MTIHLFNPRPGETLRQKQSRFVRMVSALIEYAYGLGYEMTIGDAYRDPRLHGVVGVKMGYGHPRSAHKNRLAVDLNLFLGGKYMDKTLDHEALGKFWESLSEDARWGGRFNDGNHYSLEHEGVM